MGAVKMWQMEGNPHGGTGAQRLLVGSGKQQRVAGARYLVVCGQCVRVCV